MYFAERRAELCHRGPVVLDGFADASKIRTEVVNLLKRSASFSVSTLLTTSDLVMVTIPGDERLKKDKRRYFWILIVNHGMESLDKEDRDAVSGRNLFTNKLLLEYMASNSGQV